jgi:hypothetical protein
LSGGTASSGCSLGTDGTARTLFTGHTGNACARRTRSSDRAFGAFRPHGTFGASGPYHARVFLTRGRVRLLLAAGAPGDAIE